MTSGLSSTREEWHLFEEHERPNRVHNYRICCLVAAFFMPAGAILDWIDFGSTGLWGFLPARLLSSVALLVCWALLALPLGVAWVEAVGLIVAVPPIVAIAWMIAQTGGAVSPYYAGLNLVTLGAGLLMRWRTRDSAIVSLFTILAFIAASKSAGGFENWRAVGNNLYFLTVNGFIVVVGTWVYVDIRFREFQTNRQLAVSREELQGANEQLGRQNEQLRKLDETKSNFFANISHELRTPLTLIRPSIQALLDHGPELSQSEQREHLHRIQTNTTKLLRLISDLLDLAKVEAGKMTVTMRPADVHAMVTELETSLRGGTEAKNIGFSVSIDPDLSWVTMDADKMARVCINLLSNALKFTPPGGAIHFGVSRSDGMLEFLVRDTGIGLTPEQVKHVFDRFWQADDSSVRQHQGTGIGLSLVREFTEAHKGEVKVASEPGKGTTFRARIPYRPCQPLDRSDDASAPNTLLHWDKQKSGHLVDIRNGDGAGQRPKSKPPAALDINAPLIMIAEDDEDIRLLLEQELEGHFAVRLFTNGNALIEAAAKEPPDVVVTDMMMPGKDGLTVCRELRTMPSMRGVPVVVLTARVDDETRFRCLDAGATDFLTKPFTSTELIVRLRNLAELNDIRKTLEAEKRRLEETLVKLRETEAILIRNDKLAALGRMSAGLIHEINNPLNYARQGLLLLNNYSVEMKGPEADEYRETVSDVIDGVDRVVRIVSDLRGFTRPSERLDEQVSIESVVKTTLRFFAHQWPADLHLEVRPPSALILGSSGLLVQVLVNVIQNAIDAMAEKSYANGERPSLAIRGGKDSEKVWLSIRDNGPGMTKDQQQSIFDPFYTSKDVGKGLGLGLAITHRIIADHQGTIRLDSEVGRYCEFRIEFPLAGHAVPV